MAVVKLNYVPRGTTVQRAAQYYTFRDGPDRAQRLWHTSDGRVALYDEVQAEIAAGVETATYTYRVVLSTDAVDLGPAGYHQVLAGRFERYYFIEHHNTDHPHAHVIGFRTRRLRSAELQAMRTRARQLERARAQEQHVLRAQSPDRGGEIVAPTRPQLEHARDRGIDGPGGD